MKQQGHTKIVLRLREGVADASDHGDGGGRGSVCGPALSRYRTCLV